MGKFGPWSKIDVAIEGEPLAKDGLRKCRIELEAIVKPFVTTSKTDDEILFKGKRRYLTKSPFRIGERNKKAVFALQHLYSIEAAWKAGDIDRVVRATAGFTRLHADVQLHEMRTFERVAIDAFYRRRDDDVERGRSTKELRSDNEILLLRTTWASHSNDKKHRYKNTGVELLNRHGIKSKRSKDKPLPISAKTIERRLKELGILDNADVVSRQR